MNGDELGSPSRSAVQRREFWQGLAGVERPAAPLSRRVAESWLVAAQAEHASIASFSKFSLELLSLGAPPDLIAGAHYAALDEVEHTRICFALASQFAGESLGPGCLPVPDLPGACELERVLEETIEDGCVGEALAAAEAAAASERARAAPIRAALQAIALDESSHAELAFRFVGWALTNAPQSLQQRATAAFERACARVRTAPSASVADGELDAFGRLSGDERQRVRIRWLDEIVVPAWHSRGQSMLVV